MRSSAPTAGQATRACRRHCEEDETLQRIFLITQVATDRREKQTTCQLSQSAARSKPVGLLLPSVRFVK